MATHSTTSSHGYDEPHSDNSELPALVDENSDNDSALGGLNDASSYGTSLGSSIFDRKHVHGREYAAHATYLNPVDDQERERLKWLHYLFLYMQGNELYTAPITPNIGRILDIATGTGLWAMGMADKYPGARVVAIDNAPIMPTLIPPNCSFEVEDVEKDWVFSMPFEYIHGRGLGGVVADWPRLYLQVLVNLVPGGWVEFQDYRPWVQSDDDTLERGVWTSLWNREIVRGSELYGKSLDVVDRYKIGLQDAGFTPVREQIIKIPIGTWAKEDKLKEMGEWQLIQMLESVGSYTPAIFIDVLGYSRKQTEEIMENVKRELKDMRNHWYISYYFVCGQKPYLHDGK